MNASEEIQRHLVVFDCNVYLDAAGLLGPPFTWEKFDAAIAQLARVPVPHPTDRAFDSLRSIAACTSGRFAGEEMVEVWTSSHIDTVVRGKAQQSVDADPETGYRGLGWSGENAQKLVDELIYGIVERSDGGTLGDLFPDGNPPLDHEDGMIYGACRVFVPGGSSGPGLLRYKGSRISASLSGGKTTQSYPSYFAFRLRRADSGRSTALFSA